MTESQQSGFVWSMKWFVFASHILVLGLIFTSGSSAALLKQRPEIMHGPWLDVCRSVFCLTGLWWCLATFPSPPDFGNLKTPSRAEAAWVLIAIVACALYWQRQSVWSVACLGPAFAANLWLRHSHFKWGIPYWALSGACLSSIPVFFLNWPNPQRFWAVGVLGGVWTMLDGAVVFADCVRRLKGRLQVAPA